MTPDRWKRIEQLYHAALERQEGERRRICVRLAPTMQSCAAKWMGFSGKRAREVFWMLRRWLPRQRIWLRKVYSPPASRQFR